MTIRRIFGRLALALVAMTAMAACENSNEPIILDQFFMVSGDAQTGRAGQQLAEPLVVQVNDLDGNPVRGVRVAWTVQINNGTVSSPVTTTNGQGQAEVRWTLGSQEGVNGLVASIDEPGIDNFHVEFGAMGTTTP